MQTPARPRPHPDKAVATRAARAAGLTTLWQDPDGKWRAVTGRQHVPNWAIAVEDIPQSTPKDHPQ